MVDEVTLDLMVAAQARFRFQIAGGYRLESVRCLVAYGLPLLPWIDTELDLCQCLPRQVTRDAGRHSIAATERVCRRLSVAAAAVLNDPSPLRLLRIPN